tara:strand:+ start:1567 stop:1950 length:384 start_codon:yes stop_codon:yes gene_type:complete
MTSSTAAVHAIMGTVALSLQAMADGDDDAMIVRCIGYVNGDGKWDKDTPTTPAEKAAVKAARAYAGTVQSILLRLLFPEEAEYPDENDEDQMYVEDVLQAANPATDKVYDALRCSIDARVLRMWLAE